MSSRTANPTVREQMLRSIRSYLAASVKHDGIEQEHHHDGGPMVPAVEPAENGDSLTVIELFRQQVEAVKGHCLIAKSEMEIVRALTRIITELQATNLRARRIALSNAPSLARLVNLIAVEVNEVCVAPTALDLFCFDVGITTAQAAIAETGTLVLDSSRERHRLTSLVPPVHIAIVEARNIHRTLGEALSALQSNDNVPSSIVSFVTGPSRTGDIEMTLTIGVHGPQELYVIVNDGPPFETLADTD